MKRIWKRIWLACTMIALAFTAAHAAVGLYPKKDCDKLTAQQDLNACVGDNAAAADAALNALYKKIVAADTDAKSVAGLKDSERAWVSYRDKECNWEGQSNEGGSIYPMVISGCQERMTASRICELYHANDYVTAPKACGN